MNEMQNEKTYAEGLYDGIQSAKKMQNEMNLSTGSACLLVKDNSLKKMNASFYGWLIDNGFEKYAQGHGYYSDVDWVYVNLNSKVFNPGMPGVALAPVICDHAITIGEFMTIYTIYKKYEGLKPLSMK